MASLSMGGAGASLSFGAVGPRSNLCGYCNKSLDTAGLGRQKLPCGNIMHENCVMKFRGGSPGFSFRGNCPFCQVRHRELMTVDELMKSAGLHWQRKDYSEAARLWAEVLDIQENESAAHSLGQCYVDGKGVTADADRAERLLLDARRCGNAEATFDLGILYEKTGQIPKAVDIYEAARRTGRLKAVFCLGNLYRNQGEIQKAMEFYEEARKRHHASAICNLAGLYRDQGDVKKATELYKEACDGGNSKAVLNLGLLYLSRGDEGKAAPLLAKAYHSGNSEVRSRIERLKELQNSPFDVSGEHFPVTASVRKLFKQNAPLQQILFSPGDHVLINGLSSTAGSHLNGKLGTIVKFDSRTGRYGIKVAGADAPKAIQSKNLTQIDTPLATNDASAATRANFQIGDRVWMHSLTSDAELSLNGNSGLIVNVDASTGRFGVQLHESIDEKSFRPANLRHGVTEMMWPRSIANQDQNSDLSAKTVIEENMSTAELANAEVSDALAKSRPIPTSAGGFQVAELRSLAESTPVHDTPVLLLTFDRKSEQLRECILNSPLATRVVARSGSVTPTWGSGAICLVPDVSDAPDIPGLLGSLGGSHVIVREEDEAELLVALASLPVRYKKLKPHEHRRTLPDKDSTFDVSSDGTSVVGQAASSAAGETLDDCAYGIRCRMVLVRTFWDLEFFTNTESDVVSASTWP